MEDGQKLIWICEVKRKNLKTQQIQLIIRLISKLKNTYN